MAIFGRLLQALHSRFRLYSLIFPRGKKTKRLLVFIDVRGAKNEDGLIGLRMLSNLEMCPSSMIFVTVLMMLISVNFYFSIAFLCCFCDTTYIKSSEGSLLMPFFTIHRGCSGVSFWETQTSWLPSAFWPDWQTFPNAGLQRDLIQDRTSICLDCTRWRMYSTRKDFTTLFDFSIIPGLFRSALTKKAIFNSTSCPWQDFRRTHTSVLLLLVCVSVFVGLLVLYLCASVCVCVCVCVCLCVTVTLCVTRFRLPRPFAVFASLTLQKPRHPRTETLVSKPNVSSVLWLYEEPLCLSVCTCVYVCGWECVCILYVPHCTRWGNTVFHRH